MVVLRFTVCWVQLNFNSDEAMLYFFKLDTTTLARGEGLAGFQCGCGSLLAARRCGVFGDTY